MISADTRDPLRCSFCDRPLPVKHVEVAGHSYPIRLECGCPGAVEAAKHAQAADDRARKVKAKAAFEDKLARCGIPRRYLEAVHPKAAEMASEVEAGGSLYISGGYGVGKTHLACAIARHIVRRGKRVRFTTGVDLLLDLQATYGRPESERDVLDACAKCPVLIVDDLGKEQPTDWALSRLYAIVNAREANLLPVVVTSNYEVADLAKRWAGCDRSTAEALASRLSGMARAIEAKGADRRAS